MTSVPYTYVLVWTKLGKSYIGARWAKGCHPSDLWKRYFTSSQYVLDFVAANGSPDIILIDRSFTTPQEAMQREQELQKQFDVRHNAAFLNKAIAGVYDHRDPEIVEKMRKANTGKKHSPEWIAWVTEFHRTRKRSAETGKRISAAKKGKKQSPEHIEKLRIARCGRKTSEETKRKMSASHMGNKSRIGQKLPFEHRAKIGAAHKGRKYGIIVCPHCGKSGGETGMKSHHFNHCMKKG